MALASWKNCNIRPTYKRQNVGSSSKPVSKQKTNDLTGKRIKANTRFTAWGQVANHVSNLSGEDTNYIPILHHRVLKCWIYWKPGVKGMTLKSLKNNERISSWAWDKMSHKKNSLIYRTQNHNKGKNWWIWLLWNIKCLCIKREIWWTEKDK